MNRAPIVLSGTALGLVAVVSYHTAAPSSTAVSAASAKTPAAATTAAAPTTTTSATAKTTTASSPSSAARTATGADVQYQYGDLQLKVTMSGSKITDISVVALNVTDSHSQEIDQSAIPQLRQEAIAAGSAKIDGVSGASYTSAAYEQSLQSALDKLSSTSASA